MQLIRAGSGLAFFVAVSGILGSARAQSPEEAQTPVAPAEPPPPLPPVSPPPAPAPSASAPAPEQAASVDTSGALDVRASTEVAGYADSDHVYVVSPSVGGTVSSPTSGWSVGGSYLLDVVSAASVDIVSTASRRWEEVRHVGTASGAYKPGAFGVAASGNVSREPDYLSLTGAVSITQDLNAKNVTLLLGYSHTHDVAGRSGTPFSVFSRVIDDNGLKGGATFVLNRSTILSVVGDAVIESGDTSKPYRYVALFAPGTSVPRGASVDTVTRLRLSARALEQLPLSRDRFALSARLAHRLPPATLRLDERTYVDSWGLKATTTDARALFDVGSRVQLGPHVRFHAQSAVDFWQRAYVMQPGNDFPALRTGDRQLGPLLGFTGGGSLRVQIGRASNPHAWTVGLDANMTSTQYLDDIYLTSRLSAVAAMSMDVEF